MENEDRIESVTKRLDVIIGLLLKQDAERGKSAREQIEQLSLQGMDYKEIARIFGRSPSYIASELTQIKKKRR